jgi:hypothetical protein
MESIPIFIEAAAPKIHVDSGMSLASLIPLSRFVGIASRSLDRAYTGRARIGRFASTGFAYPHSVRDVNAGLRAGEHAYNIKLGNVKRAVFIFNFEIKVFQWILHENGMVDRWGNFRIPWEALSTGFTAMRAYWDANLPRCHIGCNRWRTDEVKYVRSHR